MALRVTLITGRTIEQGTNLENKTSHNYMEAAACCELNAKNIQKLSSSRVKVKTEFGEVVVKVKENNNNPDNIAFIPMGPWANAVVNPDTSGCGMPGFKGIEAEIEATNEEIPTMKQLMARYKA